MTDGNPPQAPTRARRATNKHPQDFTGKQQEVLAKANAEDVIAAGEQMAMAGPIKVRPKRRKGVVNYTAEARPKSEPVNVPAKPTGPPKTYQVRVLASIENMTFGHEWIEQPTWDGNGNMVTPPLVGPLLVLNFEEGVEYIVDEPVYLHLKEKGYVWGDDEEDEEA